MKCKHNSLLVALKFLISILAILLVGCSFFGSKSNSESTILYSYEVAADEAEIWEYDVSTDKAAKLIRHHAKEDSAVFNSAKSKIIFDSFDPNSETKSHHLFVSDFPILSSITDFVGTDYISYGEPSVCFDTNRIIAIKSNLSQTNPRDVISVSLVEFDANGNQTNDYGGISIEAANPVCSKDGKQVLYVDYTSNPSSARIIRYDVDNIVTEPLTSSTFDCDTVVWAVDMEWVYATCAGALYKMRPYLDPVTNNAAEISVVLSPQYGEKFY